jgi:hypothetical protein
LERTCEGRRTEEERRGEELLPEVDRAMRDEVPDALAVVPLLRRNQLRTSLPSVAEISIVFE